MTNTLQPGDRVVYQKDRDFPYGNTRWNGATGTLVSIRPSNRSFDPYADVDWDDPGVKLQPYLENLQPLPAVVTPLTTEYEADSHHSRADAIEDARWAADAMHDVVAHPSHYADGRKYEPKDVIRDWGLNFNRGSAVKYISRAGRKADELEDLRKARQFLDFEIEALEAEAR